LYISLLSSHVYHRHLHSFPTRRSSDLLKPGEFIHTFGDAHIYLNHIEQVKTQIQREPRKLPILKIKRKVADIDDFTFEDFEIIRSEEHTSELQSRENLVCRLLLEKKKN